jgi:hypothetical protein
MIGFDRQVAFGGDTRHAGEVIAAEGARDAAVQAALDRLELFLGIAIAGEWHKFPVDGGKLQNVLGADFLRELVAHGEADFRANPTVSHSLSVEKGTALVFVELRPNAEFGGVRGIVLDAAARVITASGVAVLDVTGSAVKVMAPPIVNEPPQPMPAPEWKTHRHSLDV